MATRWRVFVGFFGITRAIERTIQSIETNIYEPLERSGIELIRAGHFNKPEYIEAPRSGEDRVIFDIGDLRRLRLDVACIEPQMESNIERYMSSALGVPYRDEDDPTRLTRRNSLFQLYSLWRLSQMFEGVTPSSFDAALILRPDLLYIDRMPVRQLLDQLHIQNRQPGCLGTSMRFIRRCGRAEADIVVPAWQPFGGLNDRFALATPTAALAYMKRIELVHEFCKQKQYYHSEELLAFAMQRGELRLAKTWMRAQRVRSSGVIADLDLLGRKRRIYYSLMLPWRRLIEMCPRR